MIFMEFNFEKTLFAELWNSMMQWRYIRIVAFLWLVMGYSHGFDVATESFRGLTTSIVGILALSALFDACMTVYTVRKAKKQFQESVKELEFSLHD